MRFTMNLKRTGFAEDGGLDFEQGIEVGSALELSSPIDW
jgi:hypothetical protein